MSLEQILVNLEDLLLSLEQILMSLAHLLMNGCLLSRRINSLISDKHSAMCYDVCHDGKAAI
ncbi:hypothetical protein [Peribacillus sp. YIM B13477]|uniref:hypothetical protein n=1 Tax=Peribacillus sp. YIM B13477 TaxID=3366300 RepID=UPI0036709D76